MKRSQTQPNVTWTQRVAANLKCCLTVSDTASCAMTPMKSSRSIVFLPSQNLVKTRTLYSCSTDDMVRKSCPKTCGYCIPGSNTNECIDRNPTLCPMRVSDCENVEVRSSCKFTCNACSEEPNKIAPVPISTQRPATVAPTTQRDSKSTAKKCLDQQPSLCPVIKADCQHSEVKAICAYTCGVCSGSSQLIESSRRRSPEVYSPKELCRDWNVLCPRAERECDGNQFVQTLCPYTCGTC